MGAPAPIGFAAVIERVKPAVVGVRVKVADTAPADDARPRRSDAPAPFDPRGDAPWRITTFVCAAKFGRSPGIANSSQPSDPVKLWVHGLVFLSAWSCALL